LLSNYEYFGQYGKIVKLVVNKNKVYNQHGPSGPSYSVHVTYSNQEESSLAILALDNVMVDNHLLRASFGTTKYCSNFLNKQECMNKECLYLHSFAKEADILEREDMATNQAIFHDQHLLAMRLAGIFSQERKKKIIATKEQTTKAIFPSPDSIYEKEIVQKEMRTRENSVCLSVDSNDSNNIKEKSETRKQLHESKSEKTLSENLLPGLKLDQKSPKSPQLDIIKNQPKMRKSSRFNFVTKTKPLEQNSESVDIPNFILSLINKEIFKFQYIKTRTADELDFDSIDTLIQEQRDNNPWCEFLLENNHRLSSHMLTRKFNSS
jgi:CCR4-NOT transcription complex subunit 4